MSWSTPALTSLMLLALAPALGATAGARQAARPRSAASARTVLDARATATVRVNDTGHLRLLRSYGSVLIEEGAAAGTLPGQCHVHMTVGPTVTATFSITTRYGAIYGSGRAQLHSSGRYASFGGSLTVSRGSGRYAHGHGSGGLYGVIDRRTDALTVQTEGRLDY